mmetsp:Transcript_15144/g.32662  ORF Transcript_15144/g.32662 Transcript_15144/m.32662 type:complete len:697 (-) Transcript_15144:243-2333(-)
MGDARQVVAAEVPTTEPSTDEEEETSSEDESKWRAPWGPILVVLGIELCERLSYYTLAGSQKTYLNKQLNFNPASAASLNSVFSMLCFLWCLPGGLLADTIGRYKVIVGLASIYAVGVVIAAVSVHEGLQLQLKGLFLFAALFLIPLGTGGIKPNISNFGADQIGSDTEEQKETQKKFFSYFYMSINVGVLFAFGFLVNLTTHGEPKLGIPVEDGYFAAYIAAAISMIMVVLVFVGSTRLYNLLPGGGIDGFTTMCRAVGCSLCKHGGWQAWCCVIGWGLMPVFFAVTMASALTNGPSEDTITAAPEASNVTATVPAARLLYYHYPNPYEMECGVPSDVSGHRRLSGPGALWHLETTWMEEMPTSTWDEATFAAPTRRLHGGGGGSGRVAEILTNVALALGSISCICLVMAHLNNHWLKLPKEVVQATGFTIEEVRAGFATVPIIVLINISFNMAYNAMNNAFPSQACQMNTMVGGSQLNGAFFNLADALAIIFFTPLFEKCLYPLIARIKGSHVRLGQKLIAGLITAAIANGAAAYLEVYRRHQPLMCWESVSECAPNGIHMRNISAFWMFIPFALIGAAEIMVNPCMYYFSYTAAPPRVRSLVQALNLFFNGSVSNAFTAVAMKSTFPNDLDTGNLEYYYFLNIICALVGVLLYFCLTRCGRNSQDVKEEVRDEELDPTEHTFEEDTANSQAAE